MPATGPTRIRGDMLLIAGVVLLSGVLYVGKLGFYSDDWAIIGFLTAADDQSLTGLLSLGFSFIPYRPGQAANLSVLYWMFGVSPVGYHVVNALVFAAVGVLFYRVLREIGQARLISVAVPLVFLCLPHYATNRFWYAAFAVPVCTAFYLASLYADLRVVRPGRMNWQTWKVLSIGALLASVLTYEIWLPLFFLSPLFVWYQGRRTVASATNRSVGLSAVRALALGSLTVVAILAVTAYKVLLTSRLKSATLAEHVTWFTNLLRDAVVTAIAGDFGFRLPDTLLEIGRSYPDRLYFGLAVVCGAMVLAGLFRADERAGGEQLQPRGMLVLVGFGALLFFAGYGIFFASFNAAVSSTGANNRTAMASTAGLAFIVVGFVGWVCTWLRPGRGRIVLFAGTLATVCAVGLLIINTLASFWIAASVRQDQILAILRERVPNLPAGTNLLLDASCPYVGPAPVFETWWDFSGALRMLYNDSGLVGDVVTRKVSFREDGAYSRIYGDVRGPYPYEQLAVFNVRRARLEWLPGMGAARRYFLENNPTGDSGCGPSIEGVGQPLFVPGQTPISRAPLEPGGPGN